MNTNKTWADVCEGFNAYCANQTTSFEDKFTGRTDHEQQLFSYVKIDRKIGLYKSEDNKLAIAVASPYKGQALGVHKINFDLIKEQLDRGVKAVYFGYIFNGDAVSQTGVVDASIYFGRDSLDGAMTNFSTEEKIQGSVTAAVWMVFYKVKDTNFYLSVLNDFLIDSTIIRDSVSDFDIQYDDHIIQILNTHDGSFKESLFKPSIEGGKFFGKNLIVASEDTLKLDVLGNSMIHMANGKKLTDLPPLSIQVDSSADVTVDNNVIDVKLNSAMSTLQYRWNTGTELDFMSSPENKLQYDFVIVKL